MKSSKAAKTRHLSHAPITEALIDIRVALPKESRTIEHLAELDAQFRELYPDRKTIKFFSYTVQVDSPELDEKTSAQLGYRYTSDNGTQVIQSSINGFTFSRLPPYEDWEKLKAEAKRTWDLYSDHVRPEAITRVATRYINTLVFPGPVVEFDEYLRYLPRVPKALPQALGAFFSRIVVPDTQTGLTAIITQSFQPQPKEVSVVLDIDVFKEKAFADTQEAWDVIEQLRGFKNLIFFDSITEKTVKLYL